MTPTDWPFDEEPLVASSVRPAADEHWSVAFWWLGGERHELELLYAWCVARPGEGVPRWSAIECEPVLGEEGERDVARCVIDGPALLIFQFVASLARGETLSDATSIAGLPEPPSRFVKCRLAATADAAAQLVRAPWRLLDTAMHAGMRPDHDRGPQSPSEDVPCLIRSLEPRDLTLFERDRALVVAAAERLSQETGLVFTGSWFERLGAFDLLAFPAAFTDETARVQARVHGGLAIAVSVDLNRLDGFDAVIIRCSQRTNGVTLSDEVQTATVPKRGLLEVIFGGPAGGPYATEVEVWLREARTGRSRLFCAHTFYWVRQIHLGLHLVDRQASVQSPWLDTFAKARKTRARALAMKTVSGSSGDRTTMIGDPYPAFEELARQRRDLQRRIFPPPSGARFFPVAAGAESSRLAIAEWFAEISAGADARILVADPYFDSWGLELIARAKRTDIEWVVLTCLQHRKNGGEAAETRLRAGWAQLAPLLESRNIRVLELKSARNEAAFHDRYLLTVGADGLAARGFHLSNSLQAAAVNHPLLVTPIGGDVLESVADYVRALLDVPTESDVAGDSTPGIFKRDLFPALTRSTPDPPDDPPIEDVDMLLSRTRGAESPEAFARDWSGLSFALAHSPGDVALDIVRGAGSALAQRLEAFIVASPGRKPPLGTRGAAARAESISLLQLAKGNFNDAVDRAAGYLEHWHPFRGEPWSLHYAPMMLTESDPEALVRAADRLVRDAPARERTLPEQSPAADAFAHVFSAVVDRMHRVAASSRSDDPLLLQLARSATPLLRAVAGALLFDSVRAAPDRVVSIDVLGDPEDRLLTMAAWVHRLRVAANCAGGRESDEIARIRSAIFARMEADWRNRSPDDLRAVVRLLSGPLEGSWAQSTVSELLLPLAEQGKQSRGAIDRAFAAIVSERITGVAGGNYNFYYDTDAGLTDVSAGLLASSALEDAELRALLGPTDRVVTRAVRLLARPFARSTDSSGWAGAREAITWAASYGQLIALRGGGSNAVVSVSTAWIAARDALPLAERDPLLVGDDNHLGAFGRAVQKAWREQAARET